MMHVTVPGWTIRLPDFMDVAALVLNSGFMDVTMENQLTMVSPMLTKGCPLLPTWISKPWPPIRKRRWGFGKVQKTRSCTHDRPNPHSMIHYIWQFLTPKEKLCSIQALPQWRAYAQLRFDAGTTSLSTLLRLKQPRQLPIPTTLCPKRARTNSLALLRFDFNYGDFARWMGGEFTNRNRDWTAEYDKIEETLSRNDLPSDYPPTRVDLAYRIQSEGAPLQAVYETPMEATVLRNDYDNHPAVEQNGDAIEKKFAKEEWKMYHVHFCRFVYEFIPGLIINPIQWEWDKGKGRICIDCTNGPDEWGSVNSYIPKPKEENDVECPQVYYQHAFKRFLRHIARMRTTCPNHPILVHADDIEAAFCRVLYHPDAAIAFSYVYKEFLIVPVGQVFGSRNAPSFYCVLADLRQAIAACLPRRKTTEFDPITRGCNVTVDDTKPLVQMPPDSHHPPLTAEELDRTFNASYVDDNAVVQFLEHILHAIDDSIRSAFDIFGTGDVRRGDCLQQDKWESEVSEIFVFLGFRINTRDMTVSWPLAKRQALHAFLVEIMERKPKYVSPREMARIIGIVRSASAVAPWGTFLSFNLQNSLNRAAKHAFSDNRKWWNRAKVYLSQIAIDTVHQLLETLLAEEDSPLWTRPIALFLDRDISHSVYSDACYGGIGGWSAEFSFLWRVVRDDLVRFRFKMKTIVLRSLEPDDPKANGLHINPLEYIGAVVNLWLTLKCVMASGPRDGGYILGLFSDNTTALAWMSLASRTKNPILQSLARLGAALLVAASEHLTKVCRFHYPGDQNVVADDLSRPAIYHDCVSDFVTADRGRVRAHNDRTLDTRAEVFAHWCTDVGFAEHDLRRLSDPDCLAVLGSYSRAVKRGYNKQTRDDLMADTIRGYLVAAHKYLELMVGRKIPIMDAQHGSKKERYHPFLGQMIADRRRWKKPKPRYEPLTMDMFVALEKDLSVSKNPMHTFVDKTFCVYDWSRLGVFTGFRLGEYGQSQLLAGQLFNTIPDDMDVPVEHRGEPLAFMASDFTFYDRNFVVIPHSQLLARHCKKEVICVEILWRYDKSANNFVKRRFMTTGHHIFDPVDAAVSIIHRQRLLQVSPNHPIGVWCAKSGGYRFLKDKEVTSVLRRAVDLAYPDPNHYMQKHKTQIVPHSNRVTAAVCLQQGGASNDEIAFKLRWHPTSVPTYLRDCFQAIGGTLSKTVRGVFSMTFSS